MKSQTDDTTASLFRQQQAEKQKLEAEEQERRKKLEQERIELERARFGGGFITPSKNKNSLLGG